MLHALAHCNVYTKYMYTHGVGVYMDRDKLRRLVYETIVMHHEEMAKRYRKMMQEEGFQ